MKYYMISEQDLNEILIDLENSLFTNLERLEIRDDEECDDEEECKFERRDDGVANNIDLPCDF